MHEDIKYTALYAGVMIIIDNLKCDLHNGKLPPEVSRYIMDLEYCLIDSEKYEQLIEIIEQNNNK